MTIYSDGWCDWATRRPGPPAKVFAGRNSCRGLVCHSAEGWLPGIFGELDKPERQASWHFTIALSGSLFQHYPIAASCWASGNFKANSTLIAVECEGTKDAPLTDAQAAAMLRLATDVEAAAGIKLVRGVTLWEHNEVALWETPNAGPTSCPSHRYDAFFEDLRLADEPAPPPTPIRDVLDQQILDYVDALNTAVKHFEERVENALAALDDGINRAREALKA